MCVKLSRAPTLDVCLRFLAAATECSPTYTDVAPHSDMEAGREVALSRGASKRPTDDAQQSHNALQDLFDLLRDRPQREATNILRRIRNGESVDNLLTSAKNGDQSRSVISPANQGAIKILLTNLLRSGASLEQIASTVVYEVVTLKAQPVDNDGRRANIPYSVFDGSGLLGARQSPGIPLQIGSNAARKRAATAQLSNRAPYGDDKLDMPPFILPAKPWTDITDNSIFVSCLVRDFLNYHNPYWRFLEADLFLQGMRSGKVGSDFCSPLLVNAVCALACVGIPLESFNVHLLTLYSCTLTTKTLSFSQAIFLREESTSTTKPCICGYWRRAELL